MLKLQKFRAEINYCIKLLSTPLDNFQVPKEMWRRHHKTKFRGKFKSAYRKHKNQLQIGQNEVKTIQSAKEMLRNDAKTMYLVYKR